MHPIHFKISPLSIKLKFKGVFLLLGTALLLIPAAEIRPCAPDPIPEEYYIFSPEYTEYFYSEDLPKKQDTCSLGESSGAAVHTSNTEEWRNYLGLDPSTAKDIESLIYGKNLDDLKKTSAALLTKGGSTSSALAASGSLKTNSALKNIIVQNKKDVLQYLIYAKECEKYTIFYYDPWEEKPEVPAEDMLDMEERGIKERNAATDPSLKLRYAFQIIRLSHYRNDFSQTVKYFNEMNLKNTSPLYSRILSLYAGALSRTGQPEKARYLFAIISAESADYGTTAKLDFTRIPQSEKEFNKTLSFASSNAEKIEIFEIRSLTDSVISAADLKKVREINPSSPNLERMLLNQIEKIERNYLNRFYPDDGVRYTADTEKSAESYFSFSYFKSIVFSFLDLFGINSLQAMPGKHLHSDWSDNEIKTLREIREFIGESLANYKVKTPELWKLSGVYLALLDEDYKIAENLMKSISPSAIQNRPYMQKKLKELNLMHSLMTGVKMDRSRKTAYAAAFKDLYGEASPIDVWSERHQPKMFMHRILKLALQDQDQMEASLLISNWRGFDLETFSSDELGQMLFFFEKAGKDPLEEYIVSASGLKKEKIAERYASMLIKEKNLKQAAAVLEKYPPSRLLLDYVRTESPFSSPLKILPGSMPPSRSSWNKKSFVFHMLLLEKKLSLESNPEKKALLYYEIANGWYNISHHGSWWIIADDSWSAYDEKKKYLETLVRAAEFYKKSHEFSGTNKELGAESLFLAIQAEQNMNENVNYYDDNEARSPSEEEIKSWKLMDKKYSDTEFFRTTVRECFYYRSLK